MKPSTAGLLLIVVIVLFSWLSVAMIRPVEPKPSSAPADQFSTDRAWEHLEEIARAPHPTGSVEIERVRRYLVDQLQAMGLEPDVQSTTVAVPTGPGSAIFGRVDNIVTRFLGSERGKAVLLMAHYDSVKTGPGAGDDGSGVAALLETLRALKAGPRLANDVILLLTDGEEGGLLGARAFFEQHPWAQEVGMVLNFEARGSHGPSLMFETSDGNAALIREFSKVGVPHFTFSYGYEVYRRMPNDTDFTIARQAGLPGLNFAFIEGLNRYHTALDDLERLDRGSVQHHGEFALALTRRFGDADLTARWKQGRNAIYFTLLGPIFIRYPGSFALPLALLLLAGALFSLWRGVAQGRLKLLRVLASMVLQLFVAVILGGLLMALAGQLTSPFYSYSLANGWSSTSLSLLAVALLWLAALLASFGWLHGTWGDHLLGAGLVLWSLLTLAMSAIAPGASYLFAVPLLCGVITAIVWFGRSSEARDVSWGTFAVLALSGVVVALILTPTFAMVGVALGAPTALLVGLLGSLAAWGLLSPQLALLAPGPRRGLAVLALIAGVGIAVWVQAVSEYDSVNRRPNSIFYVADTETGEARWYSYDREVDSWTQQFLGESPERAPLPEFLDSWRTTPQLSADAPLAEQLAAASVEPLGERRFDDGSRVLDLQVGWVFRPEAAWIVLQTEGEIKAVTIDAQRVEHPADDGEEISKMRLLYIGAGQGIRLGVELAGDEPLRVETVARKNGLPELAGFAYEPRPEHMMPQLGRTVDTTLIRGVKTIDPGAELPADQVDEAAAAAITS